MKKIILLPVLFFTLSGLAQITLEHTYETKLINKESNIFKIGNDLRYFTLDTVSYILKFYDNQHQLFKTVNLPSNQTHPFTSIAIPTDHLFNSDNLIEFIAFQSYDTQGDYPFKALLMNEDGAVIQDLGERNDARVIQDGNGGYKLAISLTPAYLSARFIDIYNLTGTLSIGQQQLLLKNSFAYPIPSDNELIIFDALNDGDTGSIEIYSTTGQKISSQNVKQNNGEIILNIQSLATGVYFYKIGTTSNKFIKK
ncbi:MAG: T9SS type A sorting domain-containing protein [Chryseobacterium sp.]|nr:T9SS type A sorting domain-containing protein [Chryseobacterium sp.]